MARVPLPKPNFNLLKQLAEDRKRFEEEQKRLMEEAAAFRQKAQQMAQQFMTELPKWKVTVREENSVSHTIWISTIQNQEVIDRIVAAIIGLGLEVSPTASDGSLFHRKEGSQTTIVALDVSNFNDQLQRSQILDRITDAIRKYDYFGVILKDSKGSSWRAGNIVSSKSLKNILKKGDDAVSTPEPKLNEPPPEEPKPATAGSSPRVDLQLLLKLVKATTDMSDIFFDGIDQAERKLLARELEKMCQDPTASIDDLPKANRPA